MFDDDAAPPAGELSGEPAGSSSSSYLQSLLPIADPPIDLTALSTPLRIVYRAVDYYRPQSPSPTAPAPLPPQEAQAPRHGRRPWPKAKALPVATGRRRKRDSGPAQEAPLIIMAQPKARGPMAQPQAQPQAQSAAIEVEDSPVLQDPPAS